MSSNKYFILLLYYLELVLASTGYLLLVCKRLIIHIIIGVEVFYVLQVNSQMYTDFVAIIFIS